MGTVMRDGWFVSPMPPFFWRARGSANPIRAGCMPVQASGGSYTAHLRAMVGRPALFCAGPLPFHRRSSDQRATARSPILLSTSRASLL